MILINRRIELGLRSNYIHMGFIPFGYLDVSDDPKFPPLVNVCLVNMHEAGFLSRDKMSMHNHELLCTAFIF